MKYLDASHSLELFEPHVLRRSKARAVESYCARLVLRHGHQILQRAGTARCVHHKNIGRSSDLNDRHQVFCGIVCKAPEHADGDHYGRITG